MYLLGKAKQFATKAHNGQFRKKSNRPYICHPLEVVATLKSYGYYDEYILCAAWLHDVVEDCEVTLEEIKKEFSPQIASIVDELTKRNDIDLYEQISAASKEAKIIKCADRICNLQEIDWFADKKWVNSYRNKTSKLITAIGLNDEPIFQALKCLYAKVGYLLGESNG